ncbi:hypothetical protein KC19_8G013500 [Ceratodon purpureus]|uniref:Uncharacterized protein n=1 Tax=Ceratodon purpureus TaxID=3225 RepID=A0A8T0GXR4_CERPU|nr:hypothetical protein KC19_8G013500 [Ceratodon purpureus]
MTIQRLSSSSLYLITFHHKDLLFYFPSDRILIVFCTYSRQVFLCNNASGFHKELTSYVCHLLPQVSLVLNSPLIELPAYQVCASFAESLESTPLCQKSATTEIIITP